MLIDFPGPQKSILDAFFLFSSIVFTKEFTEKRTKIVFQEKKLDTELSDSKIRGLESGSEFESGLELATTLSRSTQVGILRKSKYFYSFIFFSHKTKQSKTM